MPEPGVDYHAGFFVGRPLGKPHRLSHRFGYSEGMATAVSDPQSLTKPRRRVPLWALWLMAGVMFFVSLFLGIWFPWQRRLAIIEEIEHLGGSYTVRVSSAPEWIRELFGHPYHGFAGNPKIGPFDGVAAVDFSQTKGRANDRLSPEFVARLSAFPELQKLDLSYTSVTDDWMPQIAELKSLKQLNVGHCRISGRGFGVLKSLPNLETINLAYCPIRDPALDRLANVPSLKTIGVVYCSHLTDEGIERYRKTRPDGTIHGR